MPSIYDLKPKFQQMLRRLVAPIANSGITANQVTIFAAITSVLYGLALFYQPESHWLWLGLPLFLFIRMALNAIDGMLAREFNQKSALGGLLNEFGDVISDIALYLPFALVTGIPGWLIISIILLSILTEYVGVSAVMVGASRRYDGPMGKSDRAFFFGALALIIGLGIQLQPWVMPVLGFVVILLCITILNRIKQALAEVKS
jgi:CDP-diacylglycerol--glycerol-3-phosphate 3-phosphatidyltransferase